MPCEAVACPCELDLIPKTMDYWGDGLDNIVTLTPDSGDSGTAVCGLPDGELALLSIPGGSIDFSASLRIGSPAVEENNLDCLINSENTEIEFSVEMPARMSQIEYEACNTALRDYARQLRIEDILVRDLDMCLTQ